MNNDWKVCNSDPQCCSSISCLAALHRHNKWNFILCCSSIACLAALHRHGECLALVNKRLETDRENADLYILRARLHKLFRNVRFSYMFFFFDLFSIWGRRIKCLLSSLVLLLSLLLSPPCILEEHGSTPVSVFLSFGVHWLPCTHGYILLCLSLPISSVSLLPFSHLCFRTVMLSWPHRLSLPLSLPSFSHLSPLSLSLFLISSLLVFSILFIPIIHLNILNIVSSLKLFNDRYLTITSTFAYITHDTMRLHTCMLLPSTDHPVLLRRQGRPVYQPRPPRGQQVDGATPSEGPDTQDAGHTAQSDGAYSGSPTEDLHRHRDRPIIRRLPYP